MLLFLSACVAPVEVTVIDAAGEGTAATVRTQDAAGVPYGAAETDDGGHAVVEVPIGGQVTAELDGGEDAAGFRRLDRFTVAGVQSGDVLVLPVQGDTLPEMLWGDFLPIDWAGVDDTYVGLAECVSYPTSQGELRGLQASARCPSEVHPYILEYGEAGVARWAESGPIELAAVSADVPVELTPEWRTERVSVATNLADGVEVWVALASPEGTWQAFPSTAVVPLSAAAWRVTAVPNGPDGITYAHQSPALEEVGFDLEAQPPAGVEASFEAEAARVDVRWTGDPGPADLVRVELEYGEVGALRVYETVLVSPLLARVVVPTATSPSSTDYVNVTFESGDADGWDEARTADPRSVPDTWTRVRQSFGASL